MACEEMEAHPEEKELTSVDRKPEAAQQKEFPIDDATVMPVRGLKRKRCRGRNLATEWQGTLKERTQCKDWCRKKLAIACMEVTWENRASQKKLAVAHCFTVSSQLLVFVILLCSHGQIGVFYILCIYNNKLFWRLVM
jgi:hypothetical protein